MHWDNSESDRSGLIYGSLVDGSKLQVLNQVHKQLGINPSWDPNQQMILSQNGRLRRFCAYLLG